MNNQILPCRKGKKCGLSLEEHRILGVRLAELHNQLIDIRSQLSAAYPLSARLDVRIGRAEREASILRSMLDSYLFLEHPYLDNETGFKIYYPKRDEVLR